MPTETERPTPEEAAEIERFAVFLRRQRERITSCWMEAVRQSPKVEAADALDHHELSDHLPALFEDLTGSLQARGATGGDLRDDAESHGWHRWQQDYSLGELQRELGIVRHMVLVHGLDAFDDAEPGLSRTGRRRIRECILHFFGETEAASAEQFVQEQHRQLQDLNGKLEEAGHLLRTANAQLHEADASRLQLLRTVSHELGNALDGLNSAVLVLGQEEIEDAKRQKMFMICHRNLSDMDRLLQELTDYAVLLDGHTQTDIEPFSPALLCAELAATFRPLAARQGIVFEAYTHPALKQVTSDRLKIKQVAANLISNAIKYRKPEHATPGKVSLSLQPAEADGQWEMAVRDDGIGIAPEFLQTIFEEFQRVAPGRSEIQGAGLGLAITRRLVELMGGGISVSSELDRGSCFTISLPGG